MEINVIGGGLAGCEAAWQIAERNHQVTLYEMRPVQTTPAHCSDDLAELVCSNSLGSDQLASAGGLLKAELMKMNSFILATAIACRVPAGGALAVDRTQFSHMVTEKLLNHPRVTVIRQEVTTLPTGINLIAAGPLASSGITSVLQELTNRDNLFFYDAAAPIITGESIDYDQGFWAARYNKGTADYFNCPMTKEQYETFYGELVKAEQAPLHEGVEDDLRVFEGCMPIEVMAARGLDTLRFGPLKPVGLVDQTGKRPYAVVQLRKENTTASLLNLVGFQTRLKWGEQKRVFRLIPALSHAEFVRYGVMHRNTYINSPNVLHPTYQLVGNPNIFVAGQITGVEGYMESVSSGLLAGINICRMKDGQELITLPEITMMGALAQYISTASTRNFQPMNANFGILPPLAERIRDKQQRKLAQAQRSLDSFNDFL